MAVWGRYFYDTQDGLISFDRGLGWCPDCRGFVAMEVLPDKEALDAQEKALVDREKECACIVREAKESQFAVFRWLGLRPKGLDVASELQASIDRDRKELDHALLLLTHLGARQAPARCLVCGSTGCKPIPYHSVEVDEDSETPTVSDIQHPGCSGHLVFENCPYRFNVRLQYRVYDLTGLKIREGDMDGLKVPEFERVLA